MAPDEPVFEDPERPVPPHAEPLPVPEDKGKEERTLSSERREEHDQEGGPPS